MRLLGLNIRDAKEIHREILNAFCPECHVGLLRRHPQHEEPAFQHLVKCVVCGFTRSEQKDGANDQSGGRRAD